MRVWSVSSTAIALVACTTFDAGPESHDAGSAPQRTSLSALDAGQQAHARPDAAQADKVEPDPRPSGASDAGTSMDGVPAIDSARKGDAGAQPATTKSASPTDAGANAPPSAKTEAGARKNDRAKNAGEEVLQPVLVDSGKITFILTTPTAGDAASEDSTSTSRPDPDGSGDSEPGVSEPEVYVPAEDCSNSASCNGVDGENCINNTDDDDNGLADCNDPACAGHEHCATCFVDEALGTTTGHGVARGSTVGAADDVGASCGAEAHSSDVVLAWIAPVDGCYALSTSGSDYDTTLHVHASCDSFEELLCDDDDGYGDRSSVELEAEEGNTYLIAVDGWSADSEGNFVLDILDCEVCDDGHDNDADGFIDCDSVECLNAPPCESCWVNAELDDREGDAVIATSTAEATNDIDPSCSPGVGGKDWAFSWHAPNSGCYQFDTRGSNFDTTLHLYTACEDGFDELECNDDGDKGSTSLVQHPVSAGETYIVVVDGYDATEYGDAVLNIVPCP